MIGSLFASVRGSLGAALATLLVCQSVAVPLLDRADRVGLPVVESEHNASTCLQGHDHTICTQFSANHHSPSDPPRHGGVSHEAVELTSPVDEIAGTPDLQVSHHSRAPPLG